MNPGGMDPGGELAARTQASREAISNSSTFPNSQLSQIYLVVTFIYGLV